MNSSVPESLALASDFPRLWQDPRTPDRGAEKRMVRPPARRRDPHPTGSDYRSRSGFKGGATQTLTLPRPLTALGTQDDAQRRLSQKIDQLMDDRHGYKEIVGNPERTGNSLGRRESPSLAASSLASGAITSSNRDMIDCARKGFLTIEEISERLNVPPLRVRIWRSHGLLKGQSRQ